MRIIRLRPDHKVSTIALVPRQEELEEDLVEEQQFIQESLPVEQEKKIIGVVDLAPDEIEDEEEETITTDSLFDE